MTSLYIIQGLKHFGKTHNLVGYEETSTFISIILKWWKIVNVKTPFKGQHLLDSYQDPLTGNSKGLEYLTKVLGWLDSWEPKKGSMGTLTKETHLAFAHTTSALVEMCKYCLNVLEFKYFLPGKVQTDVLESRFGKYRTLAGSQYLVSIRQIYEVESKLRMQNFIPLTLSSNAFGQLKLENFHSPDLNSDNMVQDLTIVTDFSIELCENDFKNIEPFLPVLTYLSGYCARSALKKLKCDSCSKLLVMNKTLELNANHNLILSSDRGGLLYPTADIVNAIIYIYLVVQKLISKENEPKFLNQSNHRQIVASLAYDKINEHEFFLEDEICCNGHSNKLILKYIVQTATNIFLNNYCKIRNDTRQKIPKPSRKLQTLTDKK